MTTLPPDAVRPSRFTAHRGCHYQHVGVDKLQIWRQTSCDNCHQILTIGSYSAATADDSELAGCGLILWEGPIPEEGYRLTVHGPYWCGRCCQESTARIRKMNLLETTPFPEAMALLSKAESAKASRHSALFIRDALDLLNDRLKEETTPEVRALISNIRYSHARHLVERLDSMPRLDFGTWLDYFELLYKDFSDEVGTLRNTHPQLARPLDEFLNSHGTLWRETWEAVSDK